MKYKTQDNKIVIAEKVGNNIQWHHEDSNLFILESEEKFKIRTNNWIKI